jgi:hypothetical protein
LRSSGSLFCQALRINPDFIVIGAAITPLFLLLLL